MSDIGHKLDEILKAIIKDGQYSSHKMYSIYFLNRTFSKRPPMKIRLEKAKVELQDTITEAELNMIDVVMTRAGYRFEEAHPDDCECQEYGTNTTKDGYWKDGDFVSLEQLQSNQQGENREKNL